MPSGSRPYFTTLEWEKVSAWPTTSSSTVILMQILSSHWRYLICLLNVYFRHQSFRDTSPPSKKKKKIVWLVLGKGCFCQSSNYATVTRWVVRFLWNSVWTFDDIHVGGKKTNKLSVEFWAPVEVAAEKTVWIGSCQSTCQRKRRLHKLWSGSSLLLCLHWGFPWAYLSPTSNMLPTGSSLSRNSLSPGNRWNMSSIPVGKREDKLNHVCLQNSACPMALSLL